MQKAEIILSLLGQKARQNRNYQFSRFYRNLFNPDFYRYVSESLSIPTPDNYRIEFMIQQLRQERIPQNQPDLYRLLQEVVRLMLESIFPECRNNPSPQAALWNAKQIQATRWMIFGKTPPFEEKQVVDQLTHRIQDGRWMRLMDRLLHDSTHRLPALTDMFHNISLLNWEKPLMGSIANRYIRCKQEFLLPIEGSKVQAQRWNKALAGSMLQDWYRHPIPFLGYELLATSPVRLHIPSRVVRKRVRRYQRNGKARSINQWLHLPAEQIIKRYQGDYRQLIDDYRWADNLSKTCRPFRYYLYRSLCLTLAQKESATIEKVRAKYRLRPSILT